MKSTGVIRRIDELGRVVIPKEIRKVLRIHDGDSLEIFTDNNDNIILSKYSNIDKVKDAAINFAQTIYKFLKRDVIITDTDKVITAEGTFKKKYLDKGISSEMLKILNNREIINTDEKIKMQIIANEEIEGYFLINPIIVDSEPIGLIIMYGKEESLNETEIKIIQFVSAFFTKYLED